MNKRSNKTWKFSVTGGTKKVNIVVITFCRRLQNNGVENGLNKVELGTYWKLNDLLIRALKHFLRKLRHVHFIVM